MFARTPGGTFEDSRADPAKRRMFLSQTAMAPVVGGLHAIVAAEDRRRLTAFVSPSYLACWWCTTRHARNAGTRSHVSGPPERMSERVWVRHAGSRTLFFERYIAAIAHTRTRWRAPWRSDEASESDRRNTSPIRRAAMSGDS